MRRVTTDLQRRTNESGDSVRSVVMAHAFVVAGPSLDDEQTRSDSERDIRVGGTDSVSSSLFAGVDYVARPSARPQQPRSPEQGGRKSVLRYAGSPLRYSFSEATHSQVGHSGRSRLVRRDGLTAVPLAQPRSMAVLVGAFDDLLDPDRHVGLTEAWVQLIVTDPARPEQMVPRLRERFPHALVVRHQPASGPLLTSRGRVRSRDSRPLGGRRVLRPVRDRR